MKDRLYKLYIIDRKTDKEIAKIYSVDRTTIGNWRKKYNIPTIPHSERMKGINNPFYGKKRPEHGKFMMGFKHSKEAKEKISMSKKGKNNYNWKGDNISYNTLHRYVQRNKEKTGMCTICNEYKKTEFGNVDHKYRRKLKDYIELCRECHSLYDNLKKLKKVFIK